MGLKEFLFGKEIEGKIIENHRVMWAGSFGYACGDDHTTLDIIDSSGDKHYLAIIDYDKRVPSKSESIEEGKYIKAKTPGFFKKIFVASFLNTGGYEPVISYELK